MSDQSDQAVCPRCPHAPHNGVCYAPVDPPVFCACRGENPKPFWSGRRRSRRMVANIGLLPHPSDTPQ